MILQRYLAGRLNRSFVSIFTILTILLGTQALFVSMKTLQEYSLNFTDLLPIFGIEVLSSLPLILNVSFLFSWINWKKSLEEQREDHAALLSGWKNKNSKNIAYNFMTFITILNIACLFFIVPVLGHFVEAKFSQNLHSQLIHFSQPNHPMKVGKNYVIFFNEKNDSHFKQLTIISLKNNRPIIIQSKDGLYDPKNLSIELSSGHLTDPQHSEQKIDFDSMEFSFADKAGSQTKSSLTLSEILNQAEPIKYSEIFWRLFLILQVWIISIGFINRKISLRKNKSYHSTMLEAIAVFSCSTVLAVMINKYFQQNLIQKLNLPFSLLLLLILAGYIRNHLNDQ